MKNYLLYCHNKTFSVMELLHDPFEVSALIFRLRLNNYLIVEQRAGEEWFVFMERCKEKCQRWGDVKLLEAFLDANFFCSRQFDLEEEYWIIGFPSRGCFFPHCLQSTKSEQQIIQCLSRSKPLFVKVYQSSFPPMAYYNSDEELTVDQIQGDWTVCRVQDRYCLECKHARIN